MRSCALNRLSKFAFAAFVVAIASLTMLSACATSSLPPAPKTPSQGIYEAKLALDVAVKQGDVYAKLPRCAPGGVPVCSTLAIAQNLYSIAVKAKDAIAVGQTAVDTYAKLASPTATDLQKAVDAVSAAAAAVQQYTGAVAVVTPAPTS